MFSKQINLSLGLCAISALITPALSQAETAIVLAASDTGSIAASRAADQKAALAKKAAEREAKKAAEAQKSAETPAPAETTAPSQVPTPPAEELKEK
ncbi:MAG: hypothetical protein Q8Q40_10675 [Methylococcaceae bacterium]|nr:hypothetical protein [Methylococcaceae bacterium]